MKCPFCESLENKVLESRKLEEGRLIRRRRKCSSCDSKFTSYERIIESPIWVIKKDGSREKFSRAKILDGILRATKKRGISVEAVEALIDDIERSIHKESGREVSTTRIGELVMERLRNIDEVAYVRFASVYKQFDDVSEFAKEITRLSRN